MRTLVLAALLIAGVSASASAQVVNPNLNTNVTPNFGFNSTAFDTSRLKALACKANPTRACAESQRQSPQQRTSTSTRPSGGQGGGPRPQRRP